MTAAAIPMARRTLCRQCKRHSARAGCLLLAFWNPHPDREGEPRANSWLSVWTDQECDDMHAAAMGAHRYQDGQTSTCGVYIEVTP